MSADLLREAAAKMRERAEAAQPATDGDAWIIDRANQYANDNEVYSGPESRWSRDVATATDRETAAHIASWHPAVALAVAGVLEVAAVDFDNGYAEGDDFATDAALNVARAYLGEAS